MMPFCGSVVNYPIK